MSVLLGLTVAFAVASAPRTGKLVGHVEIGPLSPVQRPGVQPKPSPQMYARYHILITQSGPRKGQMKSQLQRVVAQLKLSSTGDFSTDLPAGTYNVSVVGGQMAMHSPPSKQVTITAGRTTKVVMSVDTGIR